MFTDKEKKKWSGLPDLALSTDMLRVLLAWLLVFNTFKERGFFKQTLLPRTVDYSA